MVVLPAQRAFHKHPYRRYEDMSKHTKVGGVFSGKEVISAARCKRVWAGDVERVDEDLEQ